ncbi:hypothetical protein [uncultured Clostridium sp.]|jgi:hypothetical protein|uniref:hypothetical protein n=1 Tax=uncultured Clostridium sp. TaxID=59620 RepID=UPI0026355F2C|nr:hypothetical protein [uncultured Clostridium sp.]
MENQLDLLKFNEQVILNLDVSDDKIFKVILALECILEFESYKAFDSIKLCKYINIPFEDIDSYFDILINNNILIKTETNSAFLSLYKLNLDYGYEL